MNCQTLNGRAARRRSGTLAVIERRCRRDSSQLIRCVVDALEQRRLLAATVYLSDLDPTFQANGWGLYEQNRSNGEKGAADGRAITLNGRIYAEGLGVHANSRLIYNLAGGGYTRFQTDVGVDDEVGGYGSVAFQVYLDGVLTAQTPTMTGASATRQFDLDVSGKSTLELHVTDGGNGVGTDHADWAGARLQQDTAVPDTTPPTPNPMTWATVPAASSSSSIVMTATTATDPSGVEYFFDETTGKPGGTDSGWQDSATYTDSGLDPLTTYTYTVLAREKSVNQNVGAPSSSASATTPEQSAVVYLSDLNPTSAVNAWGPFERDRSNGEQGAADGRTITLNGVTYAKGLGVHAHSSLTYNLAGGGYTRFKSDVGMDDEVGAGGSVVFQVYLDNVKVFDSGAMTGATATRQVDLDITAKSALELRVTDGGNGVGKDHADWAGAQLNSSTPPVPDGESPTTPANLSLVSRTDTAITFRWDASTDNVGVVAYDIFRNSAPAGTATTNQFTDSGLTANTSYQYTAIARDAAGNTSAASLPASFTTLAAPPPPSTGTGLYAEYYDNINLTNLALSRTDPTVNFNWGYGAPHSLLGPDTFSVRWSGLVQPLHTETYTFYTTSDDGVRLTVNGQLLIDKWVNQSPKEWAGTIPLTANQFYDIKLEYYDDGYSAVASLSWSSVRQAKQIIPQLRLFPSPTVSVTAPDSSASEVGPDAGLFRVERTGATIGDLVVQFVVDGSAAGGDDYIALPSSITIPAGESAATLDLTPIDDDLGEPAEFVRITLQNTAVYRADSAAFQAQVTIASEDPLPPTPPQTPAITEPLSDGFQVDAGDTHMETAAFSDINSEDTHAATDWEIWTRTATPQLVWAAHPTSGPMLFHIHLGDGVFQGPLAGQSELSFSTNYELRVRYQDSSGLWSSYGSRLFATLPAPQPVPGAPDWTLDQAGYVVETVASNLRLPADIAFVPNPGNHPLDPYYYVAELYDGIKVVTRDGTVRDYATGLLNFNPFGGFPGSGEQGLGGILVEPVTGDLFVTLPYDLGNNVHHQKILRLSSDDGGLTMARQTTILSLPEPVTSSHLLSDLSFGPDGKLYAHSADGFDAATALNLNLYRGKVLRMNLDGTPPADNPFYDGSDGVTPRDYVFAYGFRNSWGGAWRAADGQHYSAENGTGASDRFARIVSGGNYGWNGTTESMFINSLYNWNLTAIAPLRLDFIQQSTFGGSGFPAGKQDHAFVTLTGGTYVSGPNQAKSIVEFAFDANGNVTGPPVRLIHYTGNGKATAAALAAGPDGLYFSDLYVDDTVNGAYQPAARGSHILRIRYVGT